MTTLPHATSADGYDAGFVARVLEDAVASKARVYGITGLQGTGKSTLSMQVAALAARAGRNVAVLSIDDFYLDQPGRQSLARNVHPLLETRGPPGTHDIALACDVIDALLAGTDTALPRFDKISDRRLARSLWPRSGQADLVLFEGWFHKVPAQQAWQLQPALNALERDEDADGIWRRYCNDTLEHDYPALWERIDTLMFLQGPGFDVVPGWRWQQEQTLQAANPERQAMTHAQVLRFVQYFERTSRQALATLPSIADRVVRLAASRRPLDES